MVLRINDAGFRRDAIGMPATHAAQFRAVAQMKKCVVITRATGPTCLQLLEQGYDTKGFRVHAKSCDWGPMAGMVLRDPRLNKGGAGNAQYNAHEHAESMSDRGAGAGWTASCTPVKIYEDRRAWLAQTGRVKLEQKGPDRYDGQAIHKSGISFHYALLREAGASNVWGVYFDRVKNGGAFRQERGSFVVKFHPKYGDMYEPMLGMTNPPDHRSWKGEDFRNVVTGDYDLFAIWPYEEDYDHLGEDRRPLGTARGWGDRNAIVGLERNFTKRGQGTKLGNVTNRIYEVGQYLNSMIGNTATGGYGPFPNRNVIWHSDEAARPFVNDVDLPLVAFAPSGLEAGFETIQDFKTYVDECVREKIHVTLGDGWVLAPDAKKPNRLGPTYAKYVPNWTCGQMLVPDWYNR